MANDNRGWNDDSGGHAQAGAQSSGNQGNPQQHSDAGQKGGQASQGGNQNSSNQGNPNADENLNQEDRSKGGQAAHDQGTAHEFDSEEAEEAGRIGGSQ